MALIATATYQENTLRLDQPLNLPPQTRVRLIVEPLCDDPEYSPEDVEKALEELDQLCEEAPIDSGGVRLTRDQLHERR